MLFCVNVCQLILRLSRSGKSRSKSSIRFVSRIAFLLSCVPLACTLLACNALAAEPPAITKHPPNRLAKETSPYLLQHAHNPIDWYAWGEEAFQKAKADGKLIFLSVGYSSCHWCHVMERGPSSTKRSPPERAFRLHQS
ncbi:MAG: DUF255 domain-containing protein [Pirellulaceae bacterium]